MRKLLYTKISRLLFGNSDHADWILEKMQRPGSIWLTCRNLFCQHPATRYKRVHRNHKIKLIGRRRDS